MERVGTVAIQISEARTELTYSRNSATDRDLPVYRSPCALTLLVIALWLPPQSHYIPTSSASRTIALLLDTRASSVWLEATLSRVFRLEGAASHDEQKP